MKRFISLLMIVMIVSIGWGTLRVAYSQDQSAFTEIQFLTQQTGVGIRALAMGGGIRRCSQ